MEEIRKETTLRVPAADLSVWKARLRKSPMLENAVAFAALGLGGWAALWVMELLFRAVGAA